MTIVRTSLHTTESARRTRFEPSGSISATDTQEAVEEVAAEAQPIDATLTALAALDSTAGLLAQTGADTFAKRTLGQPAAGIIIGNPAGTAGNPTFALANDLAAVEGLSGTGIAQRTASDTWTASNTVTADAYFRSGRPWTDVRAYGALGNNIADDTAACQAAIDALVALGGGFVFAPPGYYYIPGGLTLPSGVTITIQGAGEWATNFDVGDNDVIAFSIASPFGSLRDLRVFGKGANANTGSFGATQPAVRHTSTVYFTNIWVNGGSRAIENQGGSDSIYDGIVAAFAYGSANIFLSQCPGQRIRGHGVDHQWPVSAPAFGYVFNARTDATAYIAGDVVTSGGYYIQCRVGGTSGTGAPTLRNYGLDITDGTVQWRLVMAQNFAGIEFNNTSEVLIEQMDFSGAYNYCAWAKGSNNYYCKFDQCIMSTAIDGGIFWQVGSRLQVTNTHIIGIITSAGFCLAAGASFTGGLQVVGCNLQFAGSGILMSASGSYYNTIIGNHFSNNTIDMTISGGVTDLSILGNVSAGASGTGIILSGASDRIAVIGNSLNGATTPIADTSTGRVKSIFGNTPNTALDAVSGTLRILGSTSGTASFVPQAAQGTPSYTLPTGTGTLAVSASGNVALNATTGALTGATNGTTNAMLAQMAASTIKGRAVGAGTGDPTDLTATQAAAIIDNPIAEITVAVDFNAANTDHAIAIPARFTKYRVTIAYVNNTGTTASITTARAGLFSATGGGGVTLAADAALSGLTSNAADTAGNTITVAALGTVTFTRASTSTIYYRVSTAQGAAASGTITVQIMAVQ